MTTNTKYPILMVHGMGFRDRMLVCYWGRIPNALKKHGSKVFFGKQDSNGSIEGSAHQLENTLKNVLKETGSEKVNVIAHSKGGLEMRYLISSMSYADKVASLTMISTPNNGSVTIDKLLFFPDIIVKIGCKICDLWFRILGDKKPDTYSAVCSMKTSSASKFNSENPDDPRVFYQSFAFVMRKMFDDIFMSFTWPIVHLFEGDSDGLLTPDGVRWTNFRGVFEGRRRRGISHCDEVDMRRSRLPIKSEDKKYDDITDFYVDIVRELKEKGL